MVERPRHRVRLGVQSDVDGMIETAVEAFFEDPVTVWIYPEESGRRQKLEEWYRLTFQIGFRAGHTYRTPENKAIAIWAPPSVPQMFDSEPESRAMAEMFRRHLGSRARPVFDGLMTIENAHPREVPHFYLSLLATAPEMQGKGLASALLEEVLGRCDDEVWPAYLETSRERNVRFYEGRGFRETGTVEIPDGGPKLWFMWRDPRPT
jgi:GNAT superfamily N-acetyltransferase